MNKNFYWLFQLIVLIAVVFNCVQGNLGSNKRKISTTFPDHETSASKIAKPNSISDLPRDVMDVLLGNVESVIAHDEPFPLLAFARICERGEKFKSEKSARCEYVHAVIKSFAKFYNEPKFTRQIAAKLILGLTPAFAAVDIPHRLDDSVEGTIFKQFIKNSSNAISNFIKERYLKENVLILFKDFGNQTNQRFANFISKLPSENVALSLTNADNTRSELEVPAPFYEAWRVAFGTDVEEEMVKVAYVLSNRLLNKAMVDASNMLAATNGTNNTMPFALRIHATLETNIDFNRFLSFAEVAVQFRELNTLYGMYLCLRHLSEDYSLSFAYHVFKDFFQYEFKGKLRIQGLVVPYEKLQNYQSSYILRRMLAFQDPSFSAKLNEHIKKYSGNGTLLNQYLTSLTAFKEVSNEYAVLRRAKIEAFNSLDLHKHSEFLFLAVSFIKSAQLDSLTLGVLLFSDEEINFLFSRNGNGTLFNSWYLKYLESLYILEAIYGSILSDWSYCYRINSRIEYSKGVINMVITDPDVRRKYIQFYGNRMRRAE